MLNLYHVELLRLCKELVLVKFVILPPGFSEEVALDLILAALQQLDAEFLIFDATPRS